uniref:Uncharacterized protein n=1 Tax=Glossina brevipalpis TaxID=37001 RepID=A0A1A9WQ19_9MUSC
MPLLRNYNYKNTTTKLQLQNYNYKTTATKLHLSKPRHAQSSRSLLKISNTPTSKDPATPTFPAHLPRPGQEPFQDTDWLPPKTLSRPPQGPLKTAQGPTQDPQEPPQDTQGGFECIEGLGGHEGLEGVQGLEGIEDNNFLFSPMVLMMILPLFLLLVLPKMINDPEAKK